LDNFAIQLNSHPAMVGYVYVQEAQISCAGYAVAHGIGLTRYLTQVRDVPWNRVAWRDVGYGDSFEVSLWLFPSGRPPLYVPEYKPETGGTFIEDCEMMIALDGRRKRHPSPGASYKRLQRTRLKRALHE
jgi:hypothetical protein